MLQNNKIILNLIRIREFEIFFHDFLPFLSFIHFMLQMYDKWLKIALHLNCGFPIPYRIIKPLLKNILPNQKGQKINRREKHIFFSI